MENLEPNHLMDVDDDRLDDSDREQQDDEEFERVRHEQRKKRFRVADAPVPADVPALHATHAAHEDAGDALHLEGFSSLSLSLSSSLTPRLSLSAQRQHVMHEWERRAALQRLGCVNEADPLTGISIDVARPVVLLVNEATRELTAFDLYSLYHMHIRRGHCRFRTVCGGRFEVGSKAAAFCDPD